MSPEGRFAYSGTEEYCNNKGFMMSGKSMKYLSAILNSTLTTWFMKNTSRTTGMGLLQWEKFATERIPIPLCSASDQAVLVDLVDRAVSKKVADRGSDTFEEERQIDRRVYELYGLNRQEIAAVERVTRS